MSVPLDSRFTFDSFVVGPGNRLAAAAARRAAESPGTSYNPLVIYSGPGLGKTHLLNAVGHLALAVQPELKVLYQTLEDFVDRLTSAIGSGTANRFREEYAGLGLLLLDDVQFLAGKGRTQEELLRIWDEMWWKNAQVVLASDRPPPEIDGLDERLISRFSGGLIVDISAPDPDTMVAIIRRKAKERGAELPGGVAEALARLSFDSVRELQGGLNRVLAVQEVEGRSVSADEVARLLGLEEVRAASEDEFSAFLSDISSTVAELVETAPWRKRLAESILHWEGEGMRTRRLEEALEADSAPEVEALISAFAADVARLRQIRKELSELEPRATGHPALKDPDRLAEAEKTLVAARASAKPLPMPPEGRTLEAFEGRYGAEALPLRAAHRVLERPGSEYNPLFVHGPRGVGKSLLLAGMGHAALERRSDIRVAYLRGSELVEELSEARKTETTEFWRRRYRSTDLFLLDDVHELEGGEELQEELFHLVDSLLRAGAQLVLSADRPPRMLGSLDARLRSRFDGGLVVEIAPPASPEPVDVAADPVEEPVAAAEVPETVAVDDWFYNPEKLAWNWLALEDRVIEELG